MSEAKLGGEPGAREGVRYSFVVLRPGEPAELVELECQPGEAHLLVQSLVGGKAVGLPHRRGFEAQHAAFVCVNTDGLAASDHQPKLRRLGFQPGKGCTVYGTIVVAGYDAGAPNEHEITARVSPAALSLTRPPLGAASALAVVNLALVDDLRCIRTVIRSLIRDADARARADMVGGEYQPEEMRSALAGLSLHLRRDVYAMLIALEKTSKAQCSGEPRHAPDTPEEEPTRG